MKYLSLASIALVALSCGCERSAPGEQSTLADNATRSTRHSDHGASATGDIGVIPVAGNVYMLTGRGGNIGVSVGEDGILIIDDQFAPVADDIRAALAGVHEGEVAYVLNTHHHRDHTDGNRVFGKEATIIAHDNVRAHLVRDDMPRVGLPVITFDDSLTVHFNGEAIRAVHFARGHTDGDSVIFFEGSKVVHMGDQFFNGRFPFVDMDHGGDPLHLADNIEAVLARMAPDTRIIPGHGPLATVDDLRTYHAMLIDTTGAVREQVAAGKSLAAIRQQGLPARWQGWGEGFISTERWIDTLHRALTAGATAAEAVNSN